MINKYRSANKELKEYRVSRVKQGTFKNGAKFINFTIGDAKRVGEKFVYDNYTIWTYQTDLDIKEDDKIHILDIMGFSATEAEYQGKKYIKRDVFADVEVIPDPQRKNQTEIVDNGFSPIGEITGEDLPF